ncbi:glycosyltransferase family 39 protein [Hymenobacter sp. UYP22]|uniref:ArnT family glycosyltransferase n=1 Tax=Hymenobacter sp. UYP22 TaxID=3156348 RepID=UPI00339283F1
MLANFKSTSSATLPAWRPASAASRSFPRSRPDAARLLLALVLALGVGVRLFHYFDNRSFFIDEIYLNVNTIKLGFWELATRPFEYEQKAPIGYLWATRLCVLLLGKKEMALRLFPLLCGLGTLAVFTSLARHYLQTWGAVVAVGVLALSPPIIYHSVEAKQYSTELLMATLALWLYWKFHARTSLGALLTWGVLGAAVLWFSFSAIFVLASIASVISARWLFTTRWRKLALYLIPFSLWLISFAVQYYFIISKYPQSGWLIDFFAKVYDGFMPLPPTSLAELKWYGQRPYNLLVHPLGLLLTLDGELAAWQSSPWRYLFKLGWLPAGLVLGGLAGLLRRHRPLFFCLLLPLLLTLLASGMRAYPFYGRFTLFLAPALLLFLGEGVDGLRKLLARRRELFGAVLALLALPLLVNTGRQLADRDLFMNYEDNRGPLLYINQHYQPGDVVYVFWNMTHAYQYYKAAYPLRYTARQGRNLKNEATGPADFLRRMQPELAALRGNKRVWFVFDYLNRNTIGEYVQQPAWYHTQYFYATTEVQRQLGQLGRRVEEYHSKPYNHYPHTAVLYELNPEQHRAQGQVKAHWLMGYPN